LKDLEIEIKAYCSDHLSLINRLISLGGKFLKRSDERDLYYNHPSRNFIETDEAFRIRRTGDETILTYKGPKQPGRAKTRIEEEVNLSDYEKLHTILLHLGFRPSGEVKKSRDTYRYHDISVCIDIVEGLGGFVELEKIGSDISKIEDELLELAENLGLSNFEKRSYLELLEEKK
jgi:adenylate cyclase, class 2